MLMEEEDNYTTYGHLKLRRKKTPKESVIEIIPDPMIAIKKNAIKILCRKTCLSFWEKLRLEPLGGPKNIEWLGFAPPLKESENQLLAEIRDLESNWKSLQFGSITPAEVGKVKGLVHCASDEDSLLGHVSKSIPMLGSPI